MGYEYGAPGALTFLSKKLGLLKKAIGNTVWVVQGTPNGKKTAYTLCGAYVADSIAPESPSSNVYVIRGSQGTDFVPPVPLNQLSWFPSLLKSQSNFSLGFNRLSDETTIDALSALQSENNTSPSSIALPDIDFPTSSVNEIARSSRQRKPRLLAPLVVSRARCAASTLPLPTVPLAKAFAKSIISAHYPHLTNP